MSEAENQKNGQDDGGYDLTRLSEVKLGDNYDRILRQVTPSCGGSAPWRHRKLAETHDLLALAQISNRIRIMGLDLIGDMHVDLVMKVPVPCVPDQRGELRVAQGARLAVTYREKAMQLPLAGYTFVEIREPRPVWHANVSPDPRQVLCLGTELPAGIPLNEVILMSYSALAMITVQLDVRDSAGLLNPAASDYFLRSPSLMPLTREPFVLGKEATHELA